MGNSHGNTATRRPGTRRRKMTVRSAIAFSICDVFDHKCRDVSATAPCDQTAVVLLRAVVRNRYPPAGALLLLSVLVGGSAILSVTSFCFVHTAVHAARLYVGELPPDVRESELETIFGKFGRLASVGEWRHRSIPVVCALLDFGRSPFRPLPCKPSP